MTMNTIHEFYLNIKLWLDKNAHDIGLPLIIILVGLISFILGQFSVKSEVGQEVRICDAPVDYSRPIRPGGYVVGKVGGQVYYLPWCPGAQKIAPEQAVWFKDEQSAQNAGYRPAKGCKGLSGAGETNQVQ